MFSMGEIYSLDVIALKRHMVHSSTKKQHSAEGMEHGVRA
jgi:hypothetical protein